MINWISKGTRFQWFTAVAMAIVLAEVALGAWFFQSRAKAALGGKTQTCECRCQP